jgi:chromosome segregation ATPase
MNPTDTTENKKSANRSTGFIIAAGAAVLLAIAAIWGNNLSGTRKSAVAELSDKLSEERQVLRNDVILHDHFRRLQDLDEQYGILLMKSPTAAQLDSANYAISSAENAMKTSIDSISSQSARFNAWANVVMSDSITSSFKKALANRKYMANVRNSIEGKPMDIKTGDKEILEMHFNMQKKEEKIASLEKELKSRIAGGAVQPQAEAKTPAVNKTELQKRNDDLESSLKEEEIRNTGLLDVTRTLKSDNEKLNAELGKVRRNNASDDASGVATKNKVNSLQEQIDDLSAELNFAKIDCNLTRADAKKIISNSRQRKELLAQALQSLQSLNKSDNSSIQQRAKQKLSELNQIASTVRD